jgi:hypothetical protein
MCLVFVSTLLATSVAAQSTTEDGIRAVLRGDYQVAARILRPLADDSVKPDPVAQFFLATLYEKGQGVRLNITRACGLFLQSASSRHAFSEQAAALANEIREQLGVGVWACDGAATWQGGPPQSFVIGADHRVMFADTSVTVIQGDLETNGLVVKPAGARYLPIRYTPLTVMKPSAMRRHFFESFYWTPDVVANPSSWTLHWELSEAMGDNFAVVATEQNIDSVSSEKPPESREATDRVRLGVNAAGEAEFTIRSTASPRTEVIPWSWKP